METLVDLFIPRTCLVCGRKLDLGERDLCVSCYSDLPFTLYWSVAANPMADTYNSLIQKRIE
ncbi:MAG: hypothetical protein K5984_06240, partial [Bacteroidales bacterium]|nr:hypothetical protein [Bacteroidales bacterium]